VWLSVERCDSPGPDGLSWNLPGFEALGLCSLSAGPVRCSAGLRMDGCSGLIETVIWCDEASSKMLAAILFSDVESVNIQNNKKGQLALNK